MSRDDSDQDLTVDRLERDLDAIGARMRSEASQGTIDFQRAFWSRMAASGDDARSPRVNSREVQVVDVVPVGRMRSMRWWAAAGVAAIFLCFLYTYARMPAAGYLVYRTGNVELSQAPHESNRLDEKSVISTDQDSKVLAAMDGDRVQLYLAPSAEMKILGEDRVALAKGSTWLSIVPNSGLFIVQTPAGEVEVHGTSFGIQTTGEQVEIYLASGVIKLKGQDGSLTEMQPGDLVTAQTGGVVVRTPGITGEKTPIWVSSLYDDFRLAYDSAYFPSTTGAKAKTADK